MWVFSMGGVVMFMWLCVWEYVMFMMSGYVSIVIGCECDVRIMNCGVMWVLC